jgi:hypothetical protein
VGLYSWSRWVQKRKEARVFLPVGTMGAQPARTFNVNLGIVMLSPRWRQGGSEMFGPLVRGNKKEGYQAR